MRASVCCCGWEVPGQKSGHIAVECYVIVIFLLTFSWLSMGKFNTCFGILTISHILTRPDPNGAISMYRGVEDIGVLRVTKSLTKRYVLKMKECIENVALAIRLPSRR